MLPLYSAVKNNAICKITLAPIWFPHWPAWRCTISRIFDERMGRLSRRRWEIWAAESLKMAPGVWTWRIRWTALKTFYWPEMVVQRDVIAMATKDRRRAEGRKGGEREEPKSWKWLIGCELLHHSSKEIIFSRTEWPEISKSPTDREHIVAGTGANMTRFSPELEDI